MNWDGPVLADSGGFQIFSLPHSREINEEGAHFQSYVDGKSYLLSPESSIEMQKTIGSDIMMAARSVHPLHCPLRSSRGGHEDSRIVGPSAPFAPETTRPKRCLESFREPAITISERRAPRF